MNVKLVALRTVRTALQAGLGVLTASGLGWIDGNVWQLAGTTAAAAAFTALHNAVDQWRLPGDD